MKKSEVLLKYADEIKAVMTERYRTVLECDGKIQYKIYIWSDGAIEVLEGVQGDNFGLYRKSCEPRELYFVTTVSAAGFNPWDYVDSRDIPEDDAEREWMRKEIIEWAVGEYAEAELANRIDEADLEEQEEERSYGA